MRGLAPLLAAALVAAPTLAAPSLDYPTGSSVGFGLFADAAIPTAFSAAAGATVLGANRTSFATTLVTTAVPATTTVAFVVGQTGTPYDLRFKAATAAFSCGAGNWSVDVALNGTLEVRVSGRTVLQASGPVVTNAGSGNVSVAVTHSTDLGVVGKVTLSFAMRSEPVGGGFPTAEYYNLSVVADTGLPCV
ncbi:MAG: hypothetical protein ACT4PT_12090 [Methanobacteriota archaeon]